MKTFVAQTADQWRNWLDEHHDSETEVWLIFYKLHTGVGSIAYLDALLYRLDRIRQARGDKGQASAGGDSPPYCRQTAGTQVNSRPPLAAVGGPAR